MHLTSLAFEHGKLIPPKYTCQGENINPPLLISNIPEGAQSLAIICDDPDAATDPNGPGHTFDHWVLWNIPPNTKQIPEGTEPVGAIEGANGKGSTGYTGPCPPTGSHRYFFRLYALASSLDLPAGSSKEDLEAAVSGHVLAQTELVGVYEKQG